MAAYGKFAITMPSVPSSIHVSSSRFFQLRMQKIQPCMHVQVCYQSILTGGTRLRGSFRVCPRSGTKPIRPSWIVAAACHPEELFREPRHVVVAEECRLGSHSSAGLLFDV